MARSCCIPLPENTPLSDNQLTNMTRPTWYVSIDSSLVHRFIHRWKYWCVHGCVPSSVDSLVEFDLSIPLKYMHKHIRTHFGIWKRLCRSISIHSTDILTSLHGPCTRTQKPWVTKAYPLQGLSGRRLNWWSFTQEHQFLQPDGKAGWSSGWGGIFQKTAE